MAAGSGEELTEALGVIVAALKEALQKDERLRVAVKRAATLLLEAVDGTAGPSASSPVAPVAAAQGTVAAPAAVREQPPAPDLPVFETPLRLGDEVRIVAVRGTEQEARSAQDATRRRDADGAPGLTPATTPPRGDGPPGALKPAVQPAASAMPAAPPAPADLSLLAKRSELKARASRWAVGRKRRLAEGDRDVGETDRDFFTQAKALPNCYLWMMDPRGVSLPPESMLEDLAGCYDALAQAVAVTLPLTDATEHEDLFEEALYLLAEAQSALRVGLLEVYPTLQDTDQREAFFWLRRQTAERGIYVGRYMKMDDTASPRSWTELQERIAALRSRLELRQQQKKARHLLMGKARYHAHRAVPDDGTTSLPDWQKLVAALEDLVGIGVPPSDLEIRELLLPILEEIPDEEDVPVGPGVRAILYETDRYLSSTSREPAQVRERLPSAEARQVAELLAGKTVILIGGVARPYAKRALEQALGLKELVWVSTISHQSVSDFEPVVARPETALVMLAIRWSSHSFGEVKSMCDRYGKPFVRLPAGYNPDQVARQVLEQVTGKLATGGG